MAFHILSTIQSIIKCILSIYRETRTSWIDSFLLFNTAAELFYWKEWRPTSTASMKTAMHIDRNLTPGRWEEIYVPLMRRRQNLKSFPICSRPSESGYIVEHYRVSDLFERSKRNQDFASFNILQYSFNILQYSIYLRICSIFEFHQLYHFRDFGS